ncbi:hypothetical protein H7097_01535 [Aeromicrobium sp.]|nr:hypothetical protein [Candidatus Saccharibacteria bacterium]
MNDFDKGYGRKTPVDRDPRDGVFALLDAMSTCYDDAERTNFHRAMAQAKEGSSPEDFVSRPVSLEGLLRVIKGEGSTTDAPAAFTQLRVVQQDGLQSPSF